MWTIFHGAQTSSRVSKTLTWFSECFLSKFSDQLPRNCFFSMFAISCSSLRADYGWQHSPPEPVGQQVNVLAKDPECVLAGLQRGPERSPDHNSELHCPTLPFHQGRYCTQISLRSLNTSCCLSAGFQHLHAVLSLCLRIPNF